MISAVVLAANPPESPLLQALHNKSALQQILENALRSGLDEIICVVAQLPVKLSVSDEKLFWLVDYGADRGKSHSLIAGLWTVNPLSAGALFIHSDQPVAHPELLHALIDRSIRSSALIAAPIFHSRPGHPMLFRRDLFPELLKLHGDQDGATLIGRYRDRTEFVETDEATYLPLDLENEKMKFWD
jgi:molybdenum cofactor cytidylyltransferase